MRVLQFKQNFGDLLNVPFSNYDAKHAYQVSCILQQLAQGIDGSGEHYLQVVAPGGNQRIYLQEGTFVGPFSKKTIRVIPGGIYKGHGESRIDVHEGAPMWVIKRAKLIPQMVSEAYSAIRASIAGFQLISSKLSKRAAKQSRSELEQILLSGELNYSDASTVVECISLAQNA